MMIVVVGGYTPEMHGGEQGITTWEVDLDDGSQPRRLDLAECASPSYLLVLADSSDDAPTERIVLACHETDPGRFSSWALADDGRLTAIADVPSGGDQPCHVSVTSTGHVVGANYMGSTVSAVAFEAGGRLGEVTGSLAFTAHGPVADRQEASHPHMSLPVAPGLLPGDSPQDHGGPGAQTVLVSDLGADLVRHLTIRADGSLVEQPELAVALPPGSGPRHFALVPGAAGEVFLVVSCELSNEVWVGRRGPRSTEWTSSDRVPATSTGVTPNLPAALRIEPGEGPAVSVLVGNRGADTVSTFRLDLAEGSLELLTELPTGGAQPRDTFLEGPGGILWNANQASGGVTALGPNGQLLQRIPSPTATVVVPLG